ncbi:MAG TPA: glycosyltransferase family 2 protein [Candidatus Paceibacterota bacterium]|jgi:glycosyltransferase involved in cell wall biosynthesis|nr:glycosyltransferase family 2 protein [Candidatus Paceibacterota bacterium]
MDLTIIIPAYNAEQFIQNNVQGLINRFNNSEIIVVDDGSNDKTFDKLSTLADKIKIIKHSQNLGKGAAIRSGFFSASGDIVIFTDADLPYGLDNIEKLY